MSSITFTELIILITKKYFRRLIRQKATIITLFHWNMRNAEENVDSIKIWARSLIKVLVIWNSINTFHFFGQSVTSIETDNQRSCRCEEKVLMWPSWYVLIPHKSHLRVLENMSVRYIATMLEHEENKTKLILW